MLAEPSLCRHLQWCTHDSLLPRGSPTSSKSRACAGGGKEKKQRNRNPSPSPSRYLVFGRVYDDDNSDSDGDRISSLAAAFSDTLPTSATLTSERFFEQQAHKSPDSKRVRKQDALTRDLIAMEPFDSTSIDQVLKFFQFNILCVL